MHFVIFRLHQCLQKKFLQPKHPQNMLQNTGWQCVRSMLAAPPEIFRTDKIEYQNFLHILTNPAAGETRPQHWLQFITKPFPEKKKQQIAAGLEPPRQERVVQIVSKLIFSSQVLTKICLPRIETTGKHACGCTACFLFQKRSLQQASMDKSSKRICTAAMKTKPDKMTGKMTN